MKPRGSRLRRPMTREAWLGALHHYLGNETPTEFDPLPEFSERYYLGRYDDAANAVRSGRYRNGYEHFLTKGKEELRSPTRRIDLAYYASRERLADQLEDGLGGDAFAHYLTFGRDRRIARGAARGRGDQRGIRAAPVPTEGRHPAAPVRTAEARLRLPGPGGHQRADGAAQPVPVDPDGARLAARDLSRCHRADPRRLGFDRRDPPHRSLRHGRPNPALRQQHRLSARLQCGVAAQLGRLCPVSEQ